MNMNPIKYTKQWSSDQKKIRGVSELKQWIVEA